MILTVALVATLLTACATPYTSGKGSITGGYYDEQLEHNKFEVTFSANGYTSAERASDLAIMRACELALSNGYKYVVAFDADSSLNEDIVYTGYGVSSSYKPVTQLITVGLLREPTQLAKYYDAEVTFKELATKNEITGPNGSPLEPSIGQFSPNPDAIQFEKLVEEELPPHVGDGVAVYRGKSALDRTGFPLARFTFIENPMADLDDFVSASKKQVTDIGANAIVVEDRVEVLHTRLNGYEVDFPKTIGFVADAYYLPSVGLGVIWDPADLVLGKFVVRKAPEADPPGFLIGDRVLEIEDIPIENSGLLAKASAGWRPGTSVQVLLIRNGREQVVDIELRPAR